MSKNLIPQIAEILGLQLGEEFKVVSKEGNEQICNFTMAGLFEHDNKESGSYNKELLAEIVCNNAEVVKLPWKPRKGDVYYTFVRTGIDCTCTLISYRWDGCVIDIALLKAGWIYRTREEAQKALPKVAAEMGAEYEL